MFKAIHNVRNQKGFTLIELLVVIAILGILAAIAIPGYLGYQKSAKERASKENFDAAYRLVKAELTKCNIDSDSVSTDIVASLNAGGKKSPWSSGDDAFTSGSTLAGGQVAIERTDLQSMCDGDPDLVQIIVSTDTGTGADMSESLIFTEL